MSKPNYESKWWGFIYDQMMNQDLQDLLDDHLRFYQTNLQGVTGPVLECGCGTGLILLPLLIDGFDMRGLDISTSMLATLKKKAGVQGVADIDRRISIQDFENFHYEERYEAIIIPSNTFRMLTSQDAQIKTLKNIYAHLIPGGRLLLDFSLIGMRNLVETPDVVEGQWHTWIHPETGRPIRQRRVGRYDFNHQLVMDQCTIEYDEIFETFPMKDRWIFKDEFQLLLRLGKFKRWECFSTPDSDPLEIGLDSTESYWIAYK
jgi:SAM-dependent methyltransferase